MLQDIQRCWQFKNFSEVQRTRKMHSVVTARQKMAFVEIAASTMAEIEGK